MTEPTTQLESLVHALGLVCLPDGRFLGPTTERALPRLFGGCVLAQAVMAAGRTVASDRHVHSLHALFLRGGDSSTPVTYEVVVLRDGRSFSARTVSAWQNGAMLATVQLSFAIRQSGPDHEWSEAAPVPSPEMLPSLDERLRPDLNVLPAWWAEPHPFDIRFIDHPEALATGGVRDPHQAYWVRAAAPVREEPLVHAALLAYVSDLTLLDPALMPHGRSWYGNRIISGASLDHAMWFHRPPSINEWLLCRQTSPIATGGRTLCECTYLSESGHRIASATQEGLLREP
ncbi:acyl-CoA thioesterase [Rhodococcus artemisiae]|uniref:Thioesterase family protein n=1 Tax=Rhodococcus artemisiae TaxID=714159 RepID=A0ABU7LKW0_9NOCA|nr:acyl-CoA thioesterase domain-containing protein [Rhodococcus artemisiae]MEE2062175.1 thioesterase family protein [Rhodococcus artemisiae]